MGADTRIEWADHTFNPWSGCQKVSPACDHCYAEAQAKRAPATFGGWGPHAERKRTSESYWRQPLLWDKRAVKEGIRPRVFCASMADVFDNAVPAEWRADLWRLISETPNLDWLLLTKRPQNILKMLPPGWKGGWPNVWLGSTVENQQEADRRIPHLLAVPAAKRFLSCEPLLGPVRLAKDGDHGTQDGAADWLTGRRWWVDVDANGASGGVYEGQSLDWIIAGGESGPKARASHPDWFRNLRDQCQAAGVPFFFKQWGEWAPADPRDEGAPFPNGWRALKGHPHIAKREDLYPEAGAAFVAKWGKKAAGALLDGREWREVPYG